MGDGGGVRRWCELTSCAVDGLVPFVGSVLGPGWRLVLELVEGVADVVRHGDVNGLVVVVPVEMVMPQYFVPVQSSEIV